VLEVNDNDIVIEFLLNRSLVFFSPSKGIDCGDVSCSRDCVAYLRQAARDVTPFQLGKVTQVTWDEEDPHASKLSGSVVMNSFRLRTCCSMKCRDHCVTSDNRVFQHRAEWPSADDSCTTHVCNEGIVSNHTSMCSPLACPRSHHLWAEGACCPTCDTDWASFCAEESDCDIACQHGFRTDPDRGCDLCKCAPATTTPLSTSSAVTETEAETDTEKAPASTSLPIAITTDSGDDDFTRSARRFYFYLDPTDATTKTLIVSLSIGLCLVIVACLAAVTCYFHRRVYRKVPLLSFGSSSA
jgi:Antistasin family